MSTRSIIVFKNKRHEQYIYVHFDGYPSNRLVEIQKFLKWNAPRNDDVLFSVANFVFWYKMESLKCMNEHYKNEKSRTITTIEDILTPREECINLHLGIGVVDDKWDEYQYKYVVDLDAKTIHIPGYTIDVVVAFDQIVEFDDKGDIIESQIPAN